MNKTTNNYINQLKLDPKKEAAVRKLVENAVDVEAVKEEVLKIPSKFEFVDLGLPSGTKWATCNVGASKPEDAGLYFAWGETEGYTAEDVAAGKKSFSWDDYKFGTRDNLTKYNATDDLLNLELADDAAYQSDNSCRMPTYDECDELSLNTTWKYEQVNGVYGLRLTSKTNGKSIFIPSTGYYNGNVLKNYGGIAVTDVDSLNYHMCYCMSIDKYGSGNFSSESRCYGYTIRPVQDASTPSTLIEKVNAIEEKVNTKRNKFIFKVNNELTAFVEEPTYSEVLEAFDKRYDFVIENEDGLTFYTCKIEYDRTYLYIYFTFDCGYKKQVIGFDFEAKTIEWYSEAGQAEKIETYIIDSNDLNAVVYNKLGTYYIVEPHRDFYFRAPTTDYQEEPYTFETIVRGEIRFSDTVYSLLPLPEQGTIIWSSDSVLDFKPNHTYWYELRGCKIPNNNNRYNPYVYRGWMKEFPNS